MAKEEKTTIGFSKSTTATIGFVLAVISALMVVKDRGADQAKAETTHGYAVKTLQDRADGSEARIIIVEKKVEAVKDRQGEFEKEIDKRFDATEKFQLKLDMSQQAILENQKGFKEQLAKQNDLQIRRLEADAKKAARDEKLYEYLKSIELIEEIKHGEESN